MSEVNLPIASFSPLYEQIKVMILASLQAAEWLPGAPIPSEIELAARYAVSQGTVRKAIDELAAQNLLVRRQGKGTFVATHQEDDWQYRFLRLAPDSGEKFHLTNQFLVCQRTKASAYIANLLKLKAGDPVIYIDRIQSFAGQPVVFEEIWLPCTRFKDLDLEILNEWHGPVYALYESKYATHMVRAEEKIKAVAADEALAKHLKLAVGAPLLSVERVAFTYGNKPVEIRHARYDTSEQHYENKLN
ncbi:GntR family transcriptional regulator [Polynucleobacter wuianus]|uniref:GntR family transcriptional regulator n=1 Tax=Polynucleobacter wuianus TaxID=1743168 RepID=A0A191UER3_9BURK|nr:MULTISPECIES: GntR family transcriptional regulator [Polynucleobacter]ANI99381.1 GntR family transcriptional regulator [Polynucleobacter wuianus]MBU3552014.1 GntR family transcriptional regulator [Polynucleobacter sp. MWH-Post4-6-1]MBU3609441.1 GntR family transcriptional regulator [Polynucleobacter wuianus]